MERRSADEAFAMYLIGDIENGLPLEMSWAA
jgi:hypothetical protein